MIRILGPNWRDELITMVSNSKNEIFVIVPYFTAYGVSLLLDNKNPNTKLKVLLSCNVGDFLSGVCDYHSFDRLVKQASEVRHLLRIHAKVFIFDQKTAIITSSNLTKRGIKTNLELGTCIDDSKAVQKLLTNLQPFWENAKVISVNDLPSLIDIQKQLEVSQATHVTQSIQLTAAITQGFEQLNDLFTETEGVTHQIITRLTKPYRVHEDAKAKIRPLLTAFHSNWRRNREKLLKTVRVHLQPNIIQKMKKKDLKMILDGIHEQFGQIHSPNIKRILKSPLSKIRNVLLYLLWGPDEIEQRLETLLNDEAWRLPYARLGFFSCMLFIKDPQRFPLYNDKVRIGLESLIQARVFRETPESYLEMAIVISKLKEEYNIPDVAVDWILWKLGTGES